MPFHWYVTLRRYVQWRDAKSEWDRHHPYVAELDDVPWNAESFEGEMR